MAIPLDTLVEALHKLHVVLFKPFLYACYILLMWFLFFLFICFGTLVLLIINSLLNDVDFCSVIYMPALKNWNIYILLQALQLGQDASSPYGFFNGQRCQMCLRSDPLQKVMERLATPGNLSCLVFFMLTVFRSLLLW